MVGVVRRTADDEKEENPRRRRRRRARPRTGDDHDNDPPRHDDDQQAVRAPAETNADVDARIIMAVVVGLVTAATTMTKERKCIPDRRQSQCTAA